MSKSFNLTEEQLNFISFMKERVISFPKLDSRLKSCLNNLAIIGKDNISEKTNKEKIIFHSPKKMIEFLSLFSRDDRFKWYTHKWDMSVPFNIDSFKEQQTINKRILSEMVYPKEGNRAVNESTYNQVWNFINFMNTAANVYPWKNTKLENIKYGWYSIVDLSKKNPNIPVENLKLADGHQFKDYLKMFKAVIEFRTDLKDEDRFSELIWYYITSNLPKDFEVTFSENFDEIGYDLNVYCDVVGVLCAINTICNWIVRHKTRSSEVKVDLVSKDCYYLLEITHCGSYFNNIEKLRNPSGDFESLRRRLFSVCDFFMTGDFMSDGLKHGAIIVAALDEKVKMVSKKMTPCDVTILEKEIGGVKYQLKIYKQQ